MNHNADGTVSMNHNADAYATMQQGVHRAYGRPLTATHTPIATNPGWYVTVHAVTSCNYTNYTVAPLHACQ
jgi:hypothetical protein